MSESWNTLRKAIPAGAAKAVAFRLNVHEDTVRHWRSRPLADESEPSSPHRRSILDRFKQLIDAVHAVNPFGPELLIEDLKAYHDELIQASLDPAAYWDRRQHAAETLREVVEAVNCLNLDASDETTLQELLEAKQSIEQAILRVRKRPRFGEGVGRSTSNSSG